MERQGPENIQKVVRSLVVALAPPQEMYQGFLSQKAKKPSLLRFYLGVKEEGENKRYTLLGGKLKPSEDFAEAIQREIGEEASLDFLGIPEQRIIGQWKYSSPKSGERDVILTYNPVLPSRKFILGDPKITDMKILQLEELKQLVEEGYLGGVPLENHLAMCDCEKDPINISENDSKLRNSSMSKALLWMSHIEDYLIKRFEQIVFRNGSPISEELFTAEYEKVLSEFMRKGVEVAVKKKTDNNKERERRNEVVEALDGDYLGKDILYFLPQLARHGVNWSGLEKATEGVKIFTRFLKRTFVDFTTQQGLTEEEYGNLMKDERTPLDRKTAQVNALNEFFRGKLKETFSISDNDLDVVMGYVQNFYRDISNEMRVADPNLTRGLYQDFTLLNEVNNANFGYLLNLFLGYDSKINTPEADRLIRFEAGRQLVLLLKGLSGIGHYQTELNKIRNGRLQNALNDFFGSVIDEQIVQLDESNKMRVRIRKRGNQLFIVDERPTKSFTSFLRKSFEERIADIKDFYSVSVTFANGNQNLEDTDVLIQDFGQFLNEQFPSSQVLMQDKRSYGTNDYLASQSGEKGHVVDGKRKGSQGNKFVRTKLFFELDKERLELIVYPLYSTGGIDNNFWGWLEKIIDDKNYVVRRLLAEEKGIPSIYGLLFPSDLYPHHYQHKLSSNYHN